MFFVIRKCSLVLKLAQQSSLDRIMNICSRDIIFCPKVNYELSHLTSSLQLFLYRRLSYGLRRQGGHLGLKNNQRRFASNTNTSTPYSNRRTLSLQQGRCNNRFLSTTRVISEFKHLVQCQPSERIHFWMHVHFYAGSSQLFKLLFAFLTVIFPDDHKGICLPVSGGNLFPVGLQLPDPPES